MQCFDKLKSIKPRWYVAGALALILIIGGGTALFVHFGHRFEQLKAYQSQSNTSRQVEQDLLSLEKYSTLKITPDQARILLPLVESLNGADATAQFDIAKKIYGSLTTSQYTMLAHQQPQYQQHTGKPGDSRHKTPVALKQDKGYRSIGTGYQNPQDAALGDVVVKFLQDRANEKSNSGQAPAQQNPNNAAANQS